MQSMKTEKTKKLPILNLENVTCYEAIEKHNASCNKTTCQKWISHPAGRNCVFVTTKNGPLTLSEIGKIYGLTRMRICQIEKTIYQKIRNIIAY